MACKTYHFLTAAHVARLHKFYIANTSPTEPALLESAVASPMNISHYEKQDDFSVLAAELATKIMKNHAFHDGNKRTGLASADMLLKVNGYRLQRTLVDSNNPTLEQVHVTNEWSAGELAKFYAKIATPIEE